MNKKMRKLTKDFKELSKDQCQKVRGSGCFCAIFCDSYCGTQVGNDGVHYSGQKALWEEPVF